MFSSLCLLKIFFSLCWIEQRMNGVRCVVFRTTSPRGGVLIYSCGFYFYTLGPGFVPRAFAYFTVNLIVLYRYVLFFLTISNHKKLVVEYTVIYIVFILRNTIEPVVFHLGSERNRIAITWFSCKFRRRRTTAIAG
jgi:hypothetical protein